MLSQVLQTFQLAILFSDPYSSIFELSTVRYNHFPFYLLHRFRKWGTNRKNKNLPEDYTSQRLGPGFRPRQSDFRSSTQPLCGAMDMRKHVTVFWVAATNTVGIELLWFEKHKFRGICISGEFLILEKNSKEKTYKQRVLMQSLPHRNEDSHNRHTFIDWNWRAVLTHF